MQNKLEEVREDLLKGDHLAMHMHALELYRRADGHPAIKKLLDLTEVAFYCARIPTDMRQRIEKEIESIEQILKGPGNGVH